MIEPHETVIALSQTLNLESYGTVAPNPEGRSEPVRYSIKIPRTTTPSTVRGNRQRCIMQAAPTTCLHIYVLGRSFLFSHQDFRAKAFSCFIGIARPTYMQLDVPALTVSWRRKQGSVRVGALALDFGEIYDWRALNAQWPAEG
jgi:hypothetical protein